MQHLKVLRLRSLASAAMAARRHPCTAALVIAAVYALAFMHGSSWSAASSRAKTLCTGSAMDDRLVRMLSAQGLVGESVQACVDSCAHRAPGSSATTGGATRGQTDPAQEWVDAIGPAVSSIAVSSAEAVGPAATGVAASPATGADAPPVRTRGNGTRAEHRVIAYSLYGSSPKYCEGAVRNAELIGSVFPGWTARFYVDGRTVPAQVIGRLRALGAEIVEVDTTAIRDQHMFWRFWAAADPTVDRFICRDVDSRLLPRDYAAVAEWVASNLAFHIERDHPSHSNYPISGGLWGGTRAAAPDMLQLIDSFPTDANYLSDMNFLNERLWPRARAASLQHDSFSCERFGARPFPMARSAEGEHVGQVFDEHGTPRQADVELLLDADSPPACRHPDDAPTRGSRRRAASGGSGSNRGRSPRALRRCRDLQDRFAVVPGASWGSAPDWAQAEWTSAECDAVLAARAST
jgi:hypothetical protein